MSQTINVVINEGQDYNFVANLGATTTGETLSVVFRTFTATGTGDVIATASGTTADTDISLSLTTSSYADGDYLLELWSKLGGADQYLIYPPEDTICKVTIQDRMRG